MKETGLELHKFPYSSQGYFQIYEFSSAFGKDNRKLFPFISLWCKSIQINLFNSSTNRCTVVEDSSIAGLPCETVARTVAAVILKALK